MSEEKVVEEQLQEIYVTEDVFWDVVKTIDWRFVCEEERVYKEIAREICERFPTGHKRLSELCFHYSKCLYEHLTRYSKAKFGSWSKFCDSTGFVHGLSDDSTWYLCTFIVGCGKEEYDRVMLDPTRICEFKDYEEGFQYCFHGDNNSKKKVIDDSNNKNPEEIKCPVEPKGSSETKTITSILTKDGIAAFLESEQLVPGKNLKTFEVEYDLDGNVSLFHIELLSRGI